MIARRAFAIGFVAAAAVLAALPPLPALAAEKVTVFAAASLKNALDEVSSAWKSASGKETASSYAASSALAKQIESGAPADIFISADLDWMTYLADKTLIVGGSQVKLLGNALVLVAPADSKASVTIAPGFDLKGVLNGGKLAIADVKAVPAGRYAKAALEKLGVWDKVEGSLAQAENVRAALKLVATGEATAGIVYQTDANEEKEVKVLGVFPEDTHPKIIYPAALVAASKNPDAADFLNFLQSPEALDIFKAHGFVILAR
ncbi:molybdate ABC transporter substrate-binding protein [Aestuariivirga sp.]|uniref:molybdate ABC transporter substrate-binding protein n=1 Tax=Aestuariivirga sp. TaxID=2650926 RepID=UPI0025BDAC5A|nr:molybdate ABC transporter substrate-binding protein [Aestuariivirga sp.]MCA3555040.1 molybdate ABC transporter substrate-binding protein [Aestuariivirga sp.]